MHKVLSSSVFKIIIIKLILTNIYVWSHLGDQQKARHWLIELKSESEAGETGEAGKEVVK